MAGAPTSRIDGNILRLDERRAIVCAMVERITVGEDESEITLPGTPKPPPPLSGGN